MDPKNGWFFRTYLDAGEYGMGLNAQSLEKLNDCPRNAEYMDAMFSDSYGNPYVVPNFMCFFERYAGDTAWRHTDEYEDKMVHNLTPKYFVMLITEWPSLDKTLVCHRIICECWEWFISRQYSYN